MTSKKSEHISHLDGWRGIAILTVLMGHFCGQGFGWLGSFGVTLFFVLSGRFMSQLLFIKKVPLSTFFFRRFSRILPTFWLYIIAIFFFAAALQPVAYEAPITELASTLFFLRTYLPGDTSIITKQWPIGHVWSLNVEEHSYLFLAAGALFCRRFHSNSYVAFFLLGSMLAVLLFNVCYAISPPAGASPWYTRSECASLGIIAGAAFWFVREKYGSAWSHRLPSIFPVASFVIAIVCFTLYSHKGFDKTVAPLCLAFTVIHVDRLPDFLKELLTLRALRWFGICSFSLYLWQQPFFLATLNDGADRALAAGLALCVGTLSFYFFENPIRQAINNMWTQRRSAAPEPERI